MARDDEFARVFGAGRGAERPDERQGHPNVDDPHAAAQAMIALWQCQRKLGRRPNQAEYDGFRDGCLRKVKRHGGLSYPSSACICELFGSWYDALRRALG